jgi:hypothetical protein
VQHEWLIVEEAGQIAKDVGERLVGELVPPAHRHRGALASYCLTGLADELPGRDHGGVADAGLRQPAERMADQGAIRHREQRRGRQAGVGRALT